MFIVSFAILGALIYYSDPSKILQALYKASLLPLLLTLPIWFFNSLLRAFRWQLFLKKISISIPFSEAWQIYTASMFVSNLSPAKTGDPIRSLILKRTNKKSFSKSLSSLVIERILDIFVLIIFGSITLFFLASKLPQLSSWFYLSLIFYFILFFLSLFFLSSPQRLDSFLSKILSLLSFIPQLSKYKKKSKTFSQKLSQSFSKYKSLPLLSSSFLLTLLIWLTQALITLLCFYSLGISISYWACVAVIPLSVLIGILTFLPGTIGSSELVRVIFFTSLFSLSLPQVTTATLLTRLVSFWVYVFLGALIFSLKFK